MDEEEEIRLINSIFSSLAKYGKQKLDQLFFYSTDVRKYVGNRQELTDFLWNHSHLFYFDHTAQKYGNQDREQYSPLLNLLFTHLISCENCTIGCLLNFVLESEDENELNISRMRQHYCGLDSDGFMDFLQDHEGLFEIDGDNYGIESEIRLNPTALNYRSINFPDLNRLRLLPDISVRDSSCTTYGTATITRVEPRHNSLFMRFITLDCAGDDIFCAMTLLSFDPQEDINVHVQAVRMYNTSCPWRATSVQLATNLPKSTSSSETKCAALFKLLRTPNNGKTAEIMIDQVQPRNVFASSSELWTFVKRNPHLFRTRADIVYLRSAEHIEALAKLVNSLGPGSYSMAFLGDTLDDVCSNFWQYAYVSEERQKRLFDFFYDHAELFAVLIEFPDQMKNEIKLLCKPLMPTLSQLEELKGAQNNNVSSLCSAIALSELFPMLSSNSDPEIKCVSSGDEETEMATEAERSCINDTPINPIDVVLLPRPESSNSKLDCSESKIIPVTTNESSNSKLDSSESRNIPVTTNESSNSKLDCSESKNIPVTINESSNSKLDCSESKNIPVTTNESSNSKLDCTESKNISVITDEPQQSVEIKQTVFTLAALSEIEKRSIELVDDCFFVDESLNIAQLFEKLKHSKLRPFTNMSTFKEFLSRRPHLYVQADDNYFFFRLDTVRRTRINELLRFSQIQRSVTELFQQLSETDQNILGNKATLFAILIKYEKLFEVTEEWDGERFVKSKGTYDTNTAVFLPQIYGDLRITSACVQENL